MIKFALGFVIIVLISLFIYSYVEKKSDEPTVKQTVVMPEHQKRKEILPKYDNVFKKEKVNKTDEVIKKTSISNTLAHKDLIVKELPDEFISANMEYMPNNNITSSIPLTKEELTEIELYMTDKER